MGDHHCVAGSDPASGDYRYYFRDHLGSTRRLLDDSKNTDAIYEFTPYGQVYAHTGETTTHLFTGHDWDPTANLYYAPFRYYAPGLARWLTRDPLGMADGPNVYSYVSGNVINRHDPLALEPGDDATTCQDKCDKEYKKVLKKQGCTLWNMLKCYFKKKPMACIKALKKNTIAAGEGRKLCYAACDEDPENTYPEDYF